MKSRRTVEFDAAENAGYPLGVVWLAKILFPAALITLSGSAAAQTVAFVAPGEEPTRPASRAVLRCHEVLEEVEESIARLRNGLPDTCLGPELHFLKGCALNLGFCEFSSLCQEGEALCETGQETLFAFLAYRGFTAAGLPDLAQQVIEVGGVTGTDGQGAERGQHGQGQQLARGEKEGAIVDQAG